MVIQLKEAVYLIKKLLVEEDQKDQSDGDKSHVKEKVWNQVPL